MIALDIRPLEPTDARAAHELVSHPEVARGLGGTPFDPLHAYEQTFREPAGVERMGAFEHGKLVAFVEIAPGSRARVAHVARFALAVPPASLHGAAATALLAAALEAADRWMSLIRLELELPAGESALQALLEQHGFAVEVRRRAAIVLDGGLADSVALARIRPGFTQPDGVLQPMPPPPPRRPITGAVVVRPATPDDAPGIARFSRDPSVLWASTQIPSMGDDYWRRRIAAGAAAGVLSVVIEVGGEVAACGVVMPSDSPRSRHVVSLGMSVIAHFQGMGLGERLLLSLLETAERWLAAERVELLVLIDNTRAVRLYEKHGFEKEGLLRFEVWRDGGYADSFMMARQYPRRRLNSG